MHPAGYAHKSKSSPSGKGGRRHILPCGMGFGMHITYMAGTFATEILCVMERLRHKNKQFSQFLNRANASNTLSA